MICDEDNKIIGIYEDTPEYIKELDLFLKGKEIVSRKEKETNGVRRIKINVRTRH